MSSSPSSSAQAARARLGGRLRKLRTGSQLTGRAFAERAGWRSAANVTKIEKGQYAITADTVRLWCQVCGASPELTAELLAEQANVADEHPAPPPTAANCRTDGDRHKKSPPVPKPLSR